jgi:hypothetical protein
MKEIYLVIFDAKEKQVLLTHDGDLPVRTQASEEQPFDTATALMDSLGLESIAMTALHVDSRFEVWQPLGHAAKTTSEVNIEDALSFFDFDHIYEDIKIHLWKKKLFRAEVIQEGELK